MSINPVCKCGKHYSDLRHFKLGSSLFRNQISFDVYVCDKCKSYWYDQDIPSKAKVYAFQTFDKYCSKNRLPSPEQIESYKVDHPDAYTGIDLEAYKRGEIQNYHPLYYSYFAEHMRNVIEQRDNAIRELQQKIKNTTDEIKRNNSQKFRNTAEISRYKNSIEDLESGFV